MKLIKILLLTVVSFLFSTAMYAQDDDIDIEEIIITDDHETDFLNQKTSISDLNNFLPRNAADLFKQIPGLYIIKRSGFAIEPSLRSFKREQLNIMTDGGTKMTHSCANRMDAMTTKISPADIKEIEIIKGPYSVRFGQSFGGIINIITKLPKRSEEFKLHGSADLAEELNGKSVSSGMELSGSGKMFDFILNGTYRDFGNYISGDDTEIASSFTAYEYSAKLGYYFKENNRIQASFRHSLAKDVLHAGLPMDAEKDDAKIFSVDYIYSNPGKKLSNIKFKAYGSLVDHLMTNEFKKNFMFVYALAPVNSKTIGGRTEFKILLNKKMKLYTGIDYNYKTKDGVRNKEIKINACTNMELDPPVEATDKIWQNSFTSDIGIFAEWHYFISNSIKIQSGLRSDLIQSDIKDPEDDFSMFYGENMKPEAHNSLDFFAKVDYKFAGDFNISFAAGKASRTPDLLELFINHSTIGQDPHEYLGNPMLKSEKNMQTDLVLSMNTKKYYVYANLFYSYIKDFISARVDTTIPRKFLPCKEPPFTKQFVNIDEVFQYGIDAGFKVSIIDGLALQTNAVYTFAHNISWDEPLPEIVPFTLNANLSYRYKKLNFALNNRYAHSQQRIAESFGETASESFNILDFYISYKLLKFLTLSFAVDNITDENYYEHTSRSYRNMTEDLMFYEPGRNIKFAIKVYF